MSARKSIIVKYLENGDIAMGLFNFSDGALDGRGSTVTFDNLGLPVDDSIYLEVTDLWTGDTFDSFNGTVAFPNCAAHSCKLYRAKVIRK